MEKQELIDFLKDNLDILLKVDDKSIGTYKFFLLEVSISLENEEICSDFIDLDDIIKQHRTDKNSKRNYFPIRPEGIGPDDPLY